ncbi:hypothetical protein QQ045_022063 [Rhodiola kirilowii]
MKMTFTLRAVKVPLNSASLEEARVRTFDFFRTARRSMSRIMDICNLHDVATISHLRSTVASQIRKNAIVTNPKISALFRNAILKTLGPILSIAHSGQNHAPSGINNLFTPMHLE